MYILHGSPVFSVSDVKAKLLFKCTADLNFPIGVSCNSAGEVIVADTGHHCIKVFTQQGCLSKTFDQNVCLQASKLYNIIMSCCFTPN